MKANFGKIFVLPDGRRPVRAHPTDACFDAFIREIQGGHSQFCLNRGVTMKCYLGFKMELKPEYWALGLPRSSLLSRGILTIGVFDPSFRGEWVAIVTNLGDSSFILEKGQKIYQFAIVPRPDGDFEDVLKEEALSPSDRGEKGFGSTNEQVII